MTGLVLLHGFTGDASSWDAVLERMPTEARELRPVLLGHGSARVRAESFEAEVDRVAALVREAGFEGARVAGYSMGARVALALLVRHPGLFSAAVLISGHPGLGAERERAARIAADEEWARLVERDGIERFVEAWELLPLFATQARLPAETREAHRARRLAHTPTGIATALRTLGLGRMPSYRDALAAVRVPVRLVCGEQDAKFVALARLMATRMPRAELRVVSGAGHDLTIEDPASCARAIRDDFEPRHRERGTRP